MRRIGSARFSRISRRRCGASTGLVSRRRLYGLCGVGCASGLLGAELKRRRAGRYVVGVEIDADAARAAAARLDDVFVLDVETAVPPIEGLHETGFITNVQAVSLPSLPRRLAVVGGGAIGIEFAQMFRHPHTRSGWSCDAACPAF